MPCAGSVREVKNYAGEHDGVIPPIVKTHLLVKVNPFFNIWVAGAAEISRITGKGRITWAMAGVQMTAYSVALGGDDSRISWWPIYPAPPPR